MSERSIKPIALAFSLWRAAVTSRTAKNQAVHPFLQKNGTRIQKSFRMISLRKIRQQLPWIDILTKNTRGVGVGRFCQNREFNLSFPSGGLSLFSSLTPAETAQEKSLAVLAKEGVCSAPPVSPERNWQFIEPEDVVLSGLLSESRVRAVWPSGQKLGGCCEKYA